MRAVLGRVVLSGGLLLVSACGGETGVTTSPQQVASVTVALATAHLLIGSTVQLTATTKDAAGNVLTGRAVTWASSAPGVGTVSAAGLVTGVSAGSATITATSEGQSGTATVTVEAPKPVVSITLDYATPLLARGQTLQLGAALHDAAGNVVAGRVLTWTSADPAIVRVDASGATGNLTAVAAGVTKITGTVDGVSAESMVTVVAIASVSAGPKVSCAITSDGKLYCAGLGYGSSAQLVAPVLRFSQVNSNGQGPGGIAQACALATDGSAHCWGDNGSGQLGVGDQTPRSDPTPVAGNFRFASVSVGRDYACGLTTASDAFCWGDGSTGQLGTGGTSGSSTPVAVQGGLKFTQLEAGSGTTCALTVAGKAYCWGRNDLGQLGTGPTGAGAIGDQNPLPAPVGDPLAATVMKQIVTRGPKTCGLTSAGKAYCWGNNTVFELGTTKTTEQCYGQKPCSTSPVPVQSSAVFSSLSASQFAACGITSAGGTLCWGMDYQNLFGSQSGAVPACPTAGATYGCTANPVAGPGEVLTLSGSNSNYCAMKADGIAYCWGGNDFGQRGWGGSTPDPNPQPFSIAPGAAH